MDTQEFERWLYYYSFMAAMSREYFLVASDLLWLADAAIKLATLTLAMMGVIYSIGEKKGTRKADKSLPPLKLRTAPDGAKWNVRASAAIMNASGRFFRRIRKFFRLSENWSPSIRLSCWSAIFAFFVVVMPFSTWYATHDAMLKQWSGIRAEVDNLKFDFGSTKNPASNPCLAERRKQIASEVAVLNRDEPWPFPPLVWYCKRAEDQRRGASPTSPFMKMDNSLSLLGQQAERQ